MFDMYRAKKKKVVDPNAPPRPNLLNHEKRLKDASSTVERQAEQIRLLNQRVSDLEAKLTNQTAYLQALHNTIQSRKRG